MKPNQPLNMAREEGVDLFRGPKNLSPLQKAIAA